MFLFLFLFYRYVFIDHYTVCRFTCKQNILKNMNDRKKCFIKKDVKFKEIYNNIYFISY